MASHNSITTSVNGNGQRPRERDESAPLLSNTPLSRETSNESQTRTPHSQKGTDDLAPRIDSMTLLIDILKLSGPIACTTVVEFLPQILIAAMVGHADPTTALPTGDGSTEGVVLTAYGLANLVYSTCAFSLVYGFICGLDSVAASSYGMTLRDCTGRETPVGQPISEHNVPAPVARGTSLPSRTIVWSSPALRGLYITPNRSRCTSALSHEHPPIGGTPGRFHLSSSVPGTTLRRSPSVPTNLALAKAPSIAALLGNLGSLEERSAFGAWKRRPDEGLDQPDTPEDHDPLEHISDDSLLSINHNAKSTALVHTHPHHHHAIPYAHSHGHPHHSHHLSITSPISNRHAKSTSSTPVNLPFTFQSIEVVPIGVTSPLSPDGMTHLDLAPSPISPTPSPNGYSKSSWDLPDKGDQEKLLASAQSQIQGTVKPISSSGGAASAGELPASLIGVWIKRCLMLELLVVATLITILYFGCAPFLRAMGEPSEAIDVSSQYVIIASFGLPFVAIYHSLNKGLQSSGIIFPVLVISFCTKFFSVAAVYAGLYHFDMTLLGIAWILTISIAMQAFAVLGYMRWAGIVQQWWGRGSANTERIVAEAEGSDFSSACTEYFNGLYEYSILAFPACAAICLEFALFDIIGALAGLLPDPSIELSVHNLLFTSTLASYMVFSGLSVSVSVLVGQKLGLAGQSHNAKQSAIVGTCACLCVSSMLILILILFHENIAHCLTSEPMLLKRFAECVPVLIIYQSVDGLNTCSTQLLRTLGVQKHAVLLHFSTYYLVGMSCGYILAFHLGRGVEGLWIGLCIGVGSNAIIATSWLWFHADWQEQCDAAKQRTVAMHDPPRASPKSYLSTSDSSRTSSSEQTAAIGSTRAENAAHHGV